MMAIRCIDFRFSFRQAAVNLDGVTPVIPRKILARLKYSTQDERPQPDDESYRPEKHRADEDGRFQFLFRTRRRDPERHDEALGHLLERVEYREHYILCTLSHEPQWAFLAESALLLR